MFPKIKKLTNTISFLFFFSYTVLTAEPSDDFSACLESQAKIFGNSPSSVRLSGVDCSKLSSKKVSNSENIAQDAGFAHSVPKLRTTFKIDGKDIKVGVWDAGRVLGSHTQLKGRVNIGDINSFLHEHATHVAGIIGSDGTSNTRSEGMATKASITSYTWKNDINELIEASKRGISITNHSYGVPLGWEFGIREGCDKKWFWMGQGVQTSDKNFGRYNKESKDFDNVIYENPALSVFVAAGNERNWTGAPHKQKTKGSTKYFDGSYCVPNGRKNWKTSRAHRKSDLHKGKIGFDTLGGKSLSKNTITIGAAKDLPKKFKPIAIKVTSFSSFGPPDDGRVKPDLIANGDKLLSVFLPDRCEVMMGKDSCLEKNIRKNEKSEVRVSSGTSMATPVVAGIGALLNQLAKKTDELKRPLHAHEMKASLIQTAISPTNDGAPTYQYGWGLVNALSAGNLVSGKEGSLLTLKLKKVDKYLRKELTWNKKHGSAKLTIVWNDKPGRISSVLDSRKKNIINHIPFYITAPSGKKYYPWSLDPQKPTKKATQNRINTVDNVVKINIHKKDYELGKWFLVGDLRKLIDVKVEIAIALNQSIKLEK